MILIWGVGGRGLKEGVDLIVSGSPQMDIPQGTRRLGPGRVGPSESALVVFWNLETWTSERGSWRRA